MSPEQSQYIWRKTIPHIEGGMGSGVFTSYRSVRFFTGLGPCLPNNLSTYGARRFHISRAEWDRVFSRLTV
ncbi:hypothetical protein LINGRAHAP2_LOCUS37580, partial [Linum grandiflorum]